MLHRSFLMLTLVALSRPAAIHAEDWPEFRGPTGQGHVRGTLPLQWGPNKNIAWKQPLPGNGWSSPVVVNGRIYLTTAAPAAAAGKESDLSVRTLCLDAASGKTLWDTEVFQQNGKSAPRIHAKNSHASPTPLCDGKVLYVHFGHQGTACLDLDGKVLWRNTDLKYAPVHGNGGTPILVDNLLVFSIDGSDKQVVVALDRASGKVVWQTDRRSKATKKFSFSTPLLITVGDQKQIISPASDMVCAYEPKEGKELWRVRYDGYSVIPRPVFGHGLLFVCSGYNRPSLYAIKPDGKGDVTDTHVAWTTNRNVPHTASPLLVGDELYMVSDAGMASCLNARTGEVYWQERTGSNYSASPIFADGRVYLLSEDGKTVVFKASKKYEELARSSINERTLASFAAVDGVLFIRGDKHLYRVQE